MTLIVCVHWCRAEQVFSVELHAHKNVKLNFHRNKLKTLTLRQWSHTVEGHYARVNLQCSRIFIFFCLSQICASIQSCL